MEELIMQGNKCCTTRDEKKGDVGDVFRIRNRIYRIVQIDECLLEDAYVMRSAEGFKSDIVFIDTIRDIYPELCSCDSVYIHIFAYVDYACDDFGYSGQCISKETCKVGEWCSKKKVVPL